MGAQVQRAWQPRSAPKVPLALARHEAAAVGEIQQAARASPRRARESENPRGAAEDAAGRGDAEGHSGLVHLGHLEWREDANHEADGEAAGGAGHCRRLLWRLERGARARALLFGHRGRSRSRRHGPDRATTRRVHGCAAADALSPQHVRHRRPAYARLARAQRRTSLVRAAGISRQHGRGAGCAAGGRIARGCCDQGHL
mmetsp:Transcript_6329/g.14617  ORF Transcript_6329/g.14617 Transcript_6329/m.14617 type:complete len:200 (+) Transcript_6329:424-1023(+)